MTQADQIRAFVISNYLEPARATTQAQVVIRAGDVHSRMGLDNAVPAVCSVLGGRKLAADSGVELISTIGVANSTTTEFTYKLSPQALTVETAERLLRERYSSIDVDVKKMVSFATRDGRSIALQRDVAVVQIWIEGTIELPNLPKDAATIYRPGQGRHADLPGRLKHEPSQALRSNGFPTIVTKIRVSSKEELNYLLDAYEGRGALMAEGRAMSPGIDATDSINLILYGPPGTGKTYETARIAVERCHGTAPLDRDALMMQYRELVSRRRVAFVSFHQSYSYEDFVEGLRPETGSADDGGDAASSSGFRLRPRPGIFRQISALASENRGSSKSPTRLDRSRRVFKIALGNSASDEEESYFDNAIEGGFIALGWGGNIDWSDSRYREFAAIKSRWQEEDPQASGKNAHIEIMTTFRSTMNVGDYVIVSDGRDRFRAIGRIAGDYYFDGAADYHPHRRHVEWLWHSSNGQSRDLFYSSQFRRHTTYQLRSEIVNWDALEQLVQGGESNEENSPDTYVLILDEINRANISKVFGELITLIEPDKRLGMKNELTVTLPYSGDTFGVPSNLHIVGTMNTADRSIALLDTALRRRFEFQELMPKVDDLPEVIDGVRIRSVLSTLNERIEYLFDRDHQIGHSYFLPCSTRAHIDRVMRRKVIPLLAEYFYEDWENIRRVLGESKDEGEFISRIRLKAPFGIDVDTITERWRYSIKPEFGPNAYLQIGS